MAEDKIAFKVEIGGIERSITTIKDFKEALSDLKKEGESLEFGTTAFDKNKKQIDDLNNSISELGKNSALSKLSSDLKKAKNDLLNGDGKAADRIAELTDQINALNSAANKATSSGIENINSSYSTFKEGIENFDPSKMKAGLSGITTAMKAIPIFLIIEGIRYLYEHFEELSKGSGILGKALRFIGDIISTVTDGINWLTDAIGITNTALDDMGKATVENANKAKEALASQTAEYDRQIAVAKASGKSAVDLEKAKQQAIIDTNKALVEQTIEYVRNKGVLDEQMKKDLTSQLEAIKNAVTQQQVITLNAEKEKTDINKKANDERLAKEKAHKAEIDRINAEEADAFFKRITDELEAERKAAEDLRKIKEDARAKDKEAELTNKEIDNAEALAKAELKVLKNQEDIDAQIALLAVKRDIELQNEMLTTEQKKVIQQQYENDVTKIKEDAAAKNKEVEKWTTENSLAAASQLTSSLQSLSDSYFYFKTKNLQKGSAEELKQAKKQFDINKGLSIASATISGIQGVINALSAQSVIPEPFGAILKGVTAVAIGASAAANIAKIASSKFDAGGGGGGSASAVASVAVPAPPTINIPSANTNSSTSFDETGKKVGGETKTTTPTIKVESSVSVQEINDKQDRVKALETQSTF